ncbi:LuxR C-terminal-related transcriptional regulator [Marivirga arenosa]|uniref:LuxR C-terminal-related transcriptional regulator n=1 Tax=Marivirga arenosa TaxID=3059076 RepID=A0AA49JDR0_9BACT|nr:LuxR C-terminal-related transcriptional regulator [Marivirga sp. ABR2-2]WKK84808.2 LuxR C-terminal-related transcriptional regulator [Marivirga sp. ABR2-2]
MNQVSKIIVVNCTDLLSIELQKEIPDIIVMGITKGTEDLNLECIKSIKKQNQRIKIIIHAENYNQNYVKTLFYSGVNAVLNRNECSSFEIKEVIEYLSTGNHYLSDGIKDQIIKEIIYPNNDVSFSNKIEKKDLELIRLIALGKTSQEIADDLQITQHIVTAKKRKLCKKFEAKNSPHLVHKAISNGLINTYNNF